MASYSDMPIFIEHSIIKRHYFSALSFYSFTSIRFLVTKNTTDTRTKIIPILYRIVVPTPPVEGRSEPLRLIISAVNDPS